jgi:hypothetical protein
MGETALPCKIIENCPKIWRAYVNLDKLPKVRRPCARFTGGVLVNCLLPLSDLRFPNLPNLNLR